MLFYPPLGAINADGSCHMDDPHCSEMEAIQSLHKKLDDDANGNIDISESTDVSLTTLYHINHPPNYLHNPPFSSSGKSSSTTQDTRTGIVCFTSTTTCTSQSVNCGRLGVAPKCTTGP